jgi:hypothetical protein
MLQIVIYSAATGRVRRVIRPNPLPQDLANYMAKSIVAGEAAYIDNQADSPAPPVLDPLQDRTNAITGKVPAGDRYVLVNAGNQIVGVRTLDPACGDIVPGARLIAHDTADDRWTVDAQGNLVAPPVIITGALTP